MKCDCINGSVINCVSQRMLYNIVSDKPPGFESFVSLKKFTIKVNISALNNVTFYLEDDNHGEVNFNEEALTFTLRLIKILTIKQAFKNPKLIHFALDKNTTLIQKTLLVR